MALPLSIRPVALALATAAAASPAGAAPAPDLGPWSLTTSSDGKGCFVTRSYERSGGTTLLLGLDRDGTNHLTVLNANWSIRPKDRLKLDFRLSGGSYARHFAVGMAADGKQGFVTTFEPKFPTYFAASKMLNIARGEVPVERLNLDGSGAAVAALRRCVEAQRSRPAARSAADDIPRDPFAAPAARKSRR